MKKTIVSLLTLALILTGCQKENQMQIYHTGQKDVIMIMVDSMTGDLIRESLKTDDFPALQFLIGNGQQYDNLVAPFPTMSVVIESTLLTGDMPDKHHIPGLTWYNSEEDRLIDYGTSIETVRKLGFEPTSKDALYNLNNIHLSPKSKTIFENLQEKRITTGAVNTLVYRGKTTHVLEVPEYIHHPTGIPGTLKTLGPDLLAFGIFHHPEELKNEILPDSLPLRAGFTDNYASDVIIRLIKKDIKPQLLLAFFPEMDKITHRNGPLDVENFKEVDIHLQNILNTYGDWNQALEQNIFILFGDHGQDGLLEDEDKMKVNLHKILRDYKIAPFDEKPSSGELVISNNHRMAYITAIKSDIAFEELAHTALKDNRIALASSIKEDWIIVWDDKQRRFRFKEGGKWTDSYGQTWTIDGDPNVLNLKIDGKLIEYTEYPDALNNLKSALKSHPNSMVVAAKPGHIIYFETAPIHNGGGEHGGLHKNDTLSALIIAGTDKKPKHLRIVDLKEYVLSLFDHL